MLNRSIQIGLVKKDKPKSEYISDDGFYDKLTIASVEVERIVKRVALCVAGYVVLDTVRKVMVEMAKHPTV